MRRRTAVPAIFIMLIYTLSLGACRLQDINDVYSMADIDKKSVTYTATEPKWLDGYLYEKLPKGKELPPILDAGEKIDVSIGFHKAYGLWASVEEAILTDNYNDIKNYTDEESAASLYENINKSNPGFINEDGTFGIGFQGVRQKALIIKYNVSNAMDYENIFSPPSLYLYDVRYDEAGEMEYVTIQGGIVGIDKPDSWKEHEWDKVTFQPNESKDIVVIVFVDEKRVVRYESHYDENHTRIIDDIETDDDWLNNLYIGTGELSKNGERGIWTNNQIVKLDIKSRK